MRKSLLFAGPGVASYQAIATTTKALRYAVSTSGIIKATGMDAKTAYKYESHKALAENLKPGTTYSYRVGYKDGWSEVENYYDLFTSKFGQPEKPVYTKVTVKDDGIYLGSYAVQDDKGNVTLYNSIKIVRTKPHTLPTDLQSTIHHPTIGDSRTIHKFIKDGQILIDRNGAYYTFLGTKH